MTVNRVAVDGLWRCLCPSFDTIVLTQSTHPLAQHPKSRLLSKARTAFPKCFQPRQISTSAPRYKEVEGPKIRFHVAKSDAPFVPGPPPVKKGWVRRVPNEGGLEGDETSTDPSTASLDSDGGYWKRKKERAGNVGYGLTEIQLRKSGKYEELKVEEVDPPEGGGRFVNATTPRKNIGGVKQGTSQWGLSQPEQEDDELAKKLQESFQRTISRERPGQAHSLRSIGESGRSATYLKTKTPKVQPDFEVGQANRSSKTFNFTQNAIQQTEFLNSTVEKPEIRSRGYQRPLWVPHREYGGDTKGANTLSSQESSVARSNREVFFQTVREQRQQLAAQLPLSIPRLLRQESTQSPPFGRPIQNRSREAETKSVVIWEQDRWDGDAIDVLHDRLRSYRTQEGNYGRVVGLVEYLIKNRGEKPSLIHYDSLIRANADAENGSAESVRALLEEMKEEEIRGDSGLYHGALQALAIHPDYALRADIMQEMKERWFGLSPEGWHSLVVGLLRDRQIEMALDKLEQMHSDDIHIQPWLYDIFTYMLCELGEVDEAYKLVRLRYENSRLGITQDHWHYLLDQFSGAYYYEATKEIWDSHVRSSELVPSDGTCVAALNLAARNADPALATSVIQILSARQTSLSPFHYEALVAAYTGIEDTKTAFRVLAIMEKAGHDPSASSTRPLYLHLSTSDALCHKAWADVGKLHKDGHAVPVTAVNVIIEALNKMGKFDAAFEYYKRLHEICPRGPNTETINVTLQGLGRTKTGGKARAMFLASEMQALNIKPDILTYDRLILICLKDDDYEDAFRYLEEMEEVGRESVENNQMGWWMRQGTAAMMARVCAVAEDERAWKIIDGMKDRGMNIVKLKEWVNANWKKDASQTEGRISVPQDG